MTKSEARKLAEQHAEWLFPFIKKVYIDAFIHGYKHGEEAK